MEVHQPSMPQGQALDRNGSQRRLLIVDDEPKLRRVLMDYFTLKHYEVRVSVRGDEALVLAGIFQPHVVLLDLLMPGLDGIATLKALKQLSPAPKVLILSGADHTDVVQGALELGADFYVCKPPQLAELEHLVDGFCPSSARNGRP